MNKETLGAKAVFARAGISVALAFSSLGAGISPVSAEDYLCRTTQGNFNSDQLRGALTSYPGLGENWNSLPFLCAIAKTAQSDPNLNPAEKDAMLRALLAAGYNGPIDSWSVEQAWKNANDPRPQINNGSEEPSYCIQVITRARDPKTGEIRNFPTPCGVPPGWIILPPPGLP
ncbi:hypothetical protein HY389_01995 [Candidatus Daviesbacteria bacterium]|nr:hypothetical protein [Candidatus Daviesbacteria bacterium]